MMINLKKSRPILAVFTLIFFYNSFAKESYTQIKTFSGQDDRGLYHLQYVSLQEPATEKINHLLYNVLVIDKLCEPDPDKKNTMHSNSKIALKTVTSNVLSFTSMDESYCGGPYPDASIQLYIFDIKRAKKIDVMNEVNNAASFKKFLAKRFQSQLPPSLDKDCKPLVAFKEILNNELQFYVENKNIIARQSYPHVTRACEFNILLNCPDVEPFLKKNSLLMDYCQNKKRL